jgi:spore coat polysaccharide biosynthesis protein SpsF
LLAARQAGWRAFAPQLWPQLCLGIDFQTQKPGRPQCIIEPQFQSKRQSLALRFSMLFRVFIQARMSSRRFPGKVLAPLAGRPLIAWVVGRVAEVVPKSRIVVATSISESDDPLAGYAASLGIKVFRGDLDNVVMRFQDCLQAHPADWFVRICADSPLLDPGLITLLAGHLDQDVDLVTNVQTRTYPRGQSVEFVNARAFATLDSRAMTPDEREHLTQVFYRNPQRFRIINITAPDAALAGASHVVDTLEDLRAIEQLLRSGPLPSIAALGAPSAAVS